jgi:hypothetical protein
MLAAGFAESQTGCTGVRCAAAGKPCAPERWNGMRRVRNTVAALLWVTALLGAQDAPSSDQKAIALLVEQVRTLQQETSELREKVKILEADRIAVSVSPPETVTPGTPRPAASASESFPGLEASLREPRGIRWRGFGEFNYKVLDQRRPEYGAYGFVAGSAGGFYTGDFDLLLTSRINDRASVLSEIVIGEGDAQSFGVDLERVLLKYDYNDHLKMSFGRYHTGIGYYNTAFHSGAWMRTTVDRPLIMEFANDGGLLPTQAVGVAVTGMVPSGKLGLNYIAEYGSSDTIRPAIDGSGNLEDENNGNHVNIGFFVRPEGLPGLQIGGSFYHDKIGDSSPQQPLRFGQTIVNAHIVYVAHGFELLNEGFLIRHVQENSQIAFNMPAFYSQLSRRFGRFRPFFRYQYVNTNKEDVVFNDVGLRYGPSFGARYDFDNNIAFKAQLDHTVRGGEPNLNGLQMQFAFTF